MLHSMGSQRAGHDLATEQQQKDVEKLKPPYTVDPSSLTGKTVWGKRSMLVCPNKFQSLCTLPKSSVLAWFWVHSRSKWLFLFHFVTFTVLRLLVLFPA